MPNEHTIHPIVRNQATHGLNVLSEIIQATLNVNSVRKPGLTFCNYNFGCQYDLRLIPTLSQYENRLSLKIRYSARSQVQLPREVTKQVYNDCILNKYNV